jgi:hypothetical protein
VQSQLFIVHCVLSRTRDSAIWSPGHVHADRTPYGSPEKDDVLIQENFWGDCRRKTRGYRVGSSDRGGAMINPDDLAQYYEEVVTDLQKKNPFLAPGVRDSRLLSWDLAKEDSKTVRTVYSQTVPQPAQSLQRKPVPDGYTVCHPQVPYAGLEVSIVYFEEITEIDNADHETEKRTAVDR